MQQLKLILILVTCFVFKASMVAGAEMEKSGSENINQAMAMSDEVIANPDYVQADPYALDWKQIKMLAANEEATESTTKSDATASVAAAPAPTASSSYSPVQNNNVHVNVRGGDTSNTNNNESGSSMSAKMQDSSLGLHTAITPMVGMSNYYGAWGNHVSNSYSLGLGLEVALNSLISIEVEGGYSKYNVGYSYFRQYSNQYHFYKHDFNQYNIGANAKLYLSRSFIQPWIGVGSMALYYENMTRDAANSYYSYNQWVGAIQPIAGLDVEVTKGIAVGMRGAYIIPMFNKPQTADYGNVSAPYFEEASLMNTSFYKVMADVKVMF